MYIVVKRGKYLCGNIYTSAGYRFKWCTDFRAAKKLLKYLAVVAAEVAKGKYERIS